MNRFSLGLSLAAALASSGCTLVLDEKVGSFTHNVVPDMTLTVIGFDAHLGERVEVLLVNGESGFVQGHAVVDTMPDVDFTIRLEDAFAADARRVDFWADNDGNGTLTPPMENPLMPGMLRFPDHMWRNELDEFGRLEFMHNTDFTNIVEDSPATTVAQPFSMSVTGADEHTGESAEVFLWRADVNVQVGYYFSSAIENGTITAALIGLIEEDVTYTIEIAIGEGESVCADFEGGAAGLTVETELGELGPCAE